MKEFIKEIFIFLLLLSGIVGPILGVFYVVISNNSSSCEDMCKELKVVTCNKKKDYIIVVCGDVEQPDKLVIKTWKKQ